MLEVMQCNKQHVRDAPLEMRRGAKTGGEIVQKENLDQEILHCKGSRKKDFRISSKNVAPLLVVKKKTFLESPPPTPLDMCNGQSLTRRLYKLP